MRFRYESDVSAMVTSRLARYICTFEFVTLLRHVIREVAFRKEMLRAAVDPRCRAIDRLDISALLPYT